MYRLPILSVTILLICVFRAQTIPLPQNGMIFYQTPMYYTGHRQQPVAPVHHAMLLHYGQPYQASGRSTTNEGGVSAFASGDTIAAGTYMRDCNPVDTNNRQYVKPDEDDVNGVQQYDDDQQPPPPQSSTIDEDGNTSAVAEAFPAADENSVPTAEIPYEDAAEEQTPPQSQQPQLPFGTKKKTPKVYLPPPTENIDPYATETPADIDSGSTGDTSLVPQPTPNYNRRKVRVELGSPESDDEDDFSPFYPRARPSGGANGGGGGGGNGGGGYGQGGNNNNHNNNNNNKKNDQYPWPVNTFFPVNFGRTSGGAIAVANSFSTGKGGSATSHATAYGSSSAKQRARQAQQQQ